jgi:hypothetical protein
MFNKITISVIILSASWIFISCDTAGVKRLDDGRSKYTGDGRKLTGKSAIEGQVIDAGTKKGIKNAKVEIKNANMGIGYYLRETEWNGYFKIDDFIPYVKYMVEVSAPGYVTYISTGTITEGSQKIELKQESVLTGVVKNSRGEPVRGVEVKIHTFNESYGEDGEYPNRKPLITATDAGGSYRFDKLPAGSYTATFTGPGFITETAQLQNIKQGETFSMPMVMIRPASVAGKVAIEGVDTPAINVDVSISGNVTYSATTLQDGSYRLEDVKPGNYKMKVTHQGFYEPAAHVIKISEGDKKEQVNFTVKAKEPQVQVYAHRYTFAPGDAVDFNIKSLRLENLKVTIYKVPIEILVRGGVDPDKLNPSESGFKSVTAWDESIREFEPYEWRYQSLQVKAELPTGGYCVEVKGAGKVISRKFFSLTTVGVVMKRSQQSIFAYATNLVNNTPISDAAIAIFDTTPIKKKNRQSTYKPPERVEDLPVEVLLKGKTDGEGIYHKKFQSVRFLSAIVIARDGSYAICNTGSPSSFEKEQKKYFIYTDRPVYRAGDTVYYKIIGKNRENRFVPVAGERVFYKIRNWDLNKVVDEGEATLDDWGTADNKFVLPKDVNLGVLEIMAGPAENNLYSRGTFYVEQYRKPEFTINITPSKDYFINGDTAEFKVEAKYFFGAPLKGALVKYRFYETRLRDADTSYWWEEDYGITGSYNRIVLEGEKYADDAGIAVLRLHAGNYPYDREITCEATVVDRSNVSISSSNKVRVGRGEFYIKIEPAQHFFSSGAKKEVTIRTLTQTGRPFSARVKVEMYRYNWKPWERVYVHDSKPLFSEMAMTDNKGVAVVNLPKQFNFYGEFDIVVNGVDRKDNVITASRVIWIYSAAGAQVASRFKNLELSVNTTELAKPGEVTCLVKSCFTDAYVCLTLEGRDVYESKVIKMTGNIMPVTFNVRAEYAPNLYVTASMQRKRALYTASAGISLPVHGTELSISIETDRPKYKPGEKAHVVLKAVDSSGKPVKADLSLAAVDEAIFQIRHDHTPPMKDFFYTKISNWVLTSYSYPITLLAGAAKDLKVKVREKFEDTAFWMGKIRTGDDGTARTSFILPDNLTTWRLTVRGHDRSGRVGEKRSMFLVTQDLIARIGKPRFLVEGDSLSLIGIVNSNTDRGLKQVDTVFKADENALEPDEKISISLPAFGSARSYYPYKVPKNTREVALQFTARADKEASDALKIPVPVERRGTPYKLFGIGDMASNKTVAIRPISETDDFTFVPESATISINPSPIIQMLRATKFLSEYPYGCIEQTLNSFIPNLALERLLGRKGFAQFINDKAKKNLEDKVRAGLERVQQHQNDDGTWGWWSGSRGNAFVTGYVLYSLHLAETAGYRIDKERVSRGLGAIRNYFKNPKLEEWDAISYLMYIHALWGRWDHEIYKKIIKIKEPGAYRLAYMVKALSLARSNVKLSDEIKKEINSEMPRLIEAAKNMAKKDGRGIYWESRGSDRWSWPGGDAEITAHVLSALVGSGDRSTLPSQIVRSLCGRSRGDAWNSTKETGTIILALCGYMEAMGGSAVTKGAVNFALDGTKIADIAYDMENMKDIGNFTRKISLEGNNSQSTFTITADGTAGADMSFDITITGTLYFKEKGLSLIKAEERSISALSNGIRITRTFAGITRVRDSRNNEYMVPQGLADKKVIRIGDELLVKVKFSALDDFQYLVLEDYLPSGFEVTKNNAYDEYQPYVHIERWDNRMVYFFTDLKKNEVYEVAYIVRAELPGSFMAKPSRMECMYEPTIQGWSVPAVVDVKKK